MAIDISTDFRTIYFENVMAPEKYHFVMSLYTYNAGNVDLLFSIIKFTNKEIAFVLSSKIQR